MRLEVRKLEVRKKLTEGEPSDGYIGTPVLFGNFYACLILVQNKVKIYLNVSSIISSLVS